MPNNTYSTINKITITSATPSVTFTSIPQNFTDLEIIVTGTYDTADATFGLQFNSDTTGSYYDVDAYGNGSSHGSYRRNGETYMQAGWYPYPSAQATPGISKINIFSYANTNINKTVLEKCGLGGGGGVYMRAGTWVKTEAITSITVVMSDNANFGAGTTLTLNGIQSAPISPKATGGAIYSDAEYYYHVFGATGTFTPLQSLTCDTLIIAGGGGGGGRVGGGGGAGGYRLLTGISASVTPYTITVGAGGTGQIYGGAASTNGNNSSALGNSATGGGKGGDNNSNNGVAGGSGGGANGNSSTTGGSGNAGGYTPVEGYAGGNSTFVPTSGAGGGGGGAGGVGANGISGVGGTGGAGVAVSPAWLIATGIGYNGYIAGGGGGGTESGYTAGSAGSGGAGTGSSSAVAATSGMSNTGSGGGGGGCCSANQNGGNGGSGVVIVRYLK